LFIVLFFCKIGRFSFVYINNFRFSASCKILKKNQHNFSIVELHSAGTHR